ncbi:MAG: T9SS type A sorting domain-containing protein [Flavobacteriales bacterium]|jgi:uncharacterized delta-60 repeat protein|nr:T9SS type A sorting domain-containing protein [Flavobacteriales bacterium]
MMRHLLFFAASACSSLAAGQWISGVDPGFAGGLRTWDHGGNLPSVASDVFHRPDGNTLVVGANASQLSQPGALFTALLDPDGRRVLSYGHHGECDYYPWVYDGTWYNQFVAADMQSDGKVLVVLLNQNFGSQQLVRLLTDGTPDPSFGPDGAIALPAGQVMDLVVQSDDGIVLIGDDGSGHHCVRRRLASGAVDTSFGVGGSFISTGSGGFNRVELLNSGKILVAGVGLARLNANGALDTTFGTNGWSTNPFFNMYFTWDMEEQPNGKVLVSSSNKIRRLLADGNTLDPMFPFDLNSPIGATRLRAAADGSWYYLFNEVVHYDANDQFDNTFGGFGAAELAIGTVTDFNLDDGTGLDLFGYVQAGEPFHYEVAIERLDLSGALVGSWGANGRMELNGNGGSENVESMAVGNDGHIWTVGSSYQSPSMMARFLPDGSPDLGFAFAGAEYGPSIQNNSIGVNSAGSGVVGGTNPVGNLASAWVHRVGIDGVVDPIWGGGVTVTGTQSDNQRCRDLLVLPDDRTAMLINLSSFGNPNGSNSAVVMLDTSGAVDAGFGNAGQVITSGNGPSIMSGMAHLPGGGLLCTGTLFTNGISELFAYAMDIDGQPLSGFGTNGVAVISVQPGNFSASVGRPLVRPDGSFYMLYTNGAASWVSRILANGTLDLSFANGSYEINPAWTGSGMGLLSNGDLLVSCSEYYGSMPILKIDANGTLVGAFGTNGVYTISDTSHVLFGTSLIKVLPGDTVLIAGDLRNKGFWDDQGIDAFLFRFDPDLNVIIAAGSAPDGLVCAPNPNQGCFIVRGDALTGATSLSVHDLSGRPVNVVIERIGDERRIHLPPSVKDGAYAVTATTPYGVFRTKIIVQR